MNREKVKTRTIDGKTIPSFLLPSAGGWASQDTTTNSVQPVEGNFFKHYSNAQYQPKLIVLKRKYGMEGYGRFWILIEIMCESKGYQIEQEKYVLEAVAEQTRCSIEELNNFIKDCIYYFKLFAQGDGFIYSPYLTNEMAERDAIRESRKYWSGICGDKHPAWRGGISFKPYPSNWTLNFRREIRARDNYTCRICGKYPSNHVHHINYDKKNCDPLNLITLCHTCHMKTNGKRDYWINFFKETGGFPPM